MKAKMEPKRNKPDYANSLNHKGWLFLKNNELRGQFRQANLQGVCESLLPLAVAHLTASYTRQWVPFCSLTVVWLTSMLSFFTIDLSDEVEE